MAQLYVTPGEQSSLEATRARELTALPVYTASTVATELPANDICGGGRGRAGEEGGEEVTMAGRRNQPLPRVLDSNSAGPLANLKETHA